MMNPVMQRCSCREYTETAVPEELLRQLGMTEDLPPETVKKDDDDLY